MKWLGYRRVTVESLRLPGDIGRRTKQPNVVALAADVGELGNELIHAPTIRDDGEFAAGGDRMAAVLLRKDRYVWVHVFEGTDQDLQDVRDSENLHRRQDDRAALIARRVRNVSEAIAAERHAAKVAKGADLTQQEGGTVSRVPTSREKGKARAKVAKQAGVTPAAVRKAEQRQRAKDIPSSAGLPARPDEVAPEAARGGEAATIPLLCPIDVMGEKPGRPFIENVTVAIAVIENVGAFLRQADFALGLLKDAGYPWERVKQIRTAIQEAKRTAQASRPALTCAYCDDPDGTKGLRAECNGCMGHGFLVEEQRAFVPRDRFGTGVAPPKKKADTAVNTIEWTLDAEKWPEVDLSKPPADMPPLEDTTADEPLEPWDDSQ